MSAAAALLQGGTTPSINDIADAADVSRRTVYLYFPTLDQLLLDATVGLLSQAAVDEAIDAADRGDDAVARVEAMIRALFAVSSDTMTLGRSLIRLTVAPDESSGDGPRRGYRRITWLERALEPLRTELSPKKFERLVSGLSMIVGWEALVVLQDLRDLNAKEQLETTLWSARALIRAALHGS
ncbi:MAG: hypothetical protein QOJ00_1278 [Actinomycetota bacterium]